jgi:transposase, IS5 family
VQIGRYANAKQYRRVHRELKKLKGRLGRVARDLERKTAAWDAVPEAMPGNWPSRTASSPSNGRVPTSCTACMRRRWSASSKGKAHKRYEIGVKIGIVACLKEPFILAAHALPAAVKHSVVCESIYAASLSGVA